MAEDCPDGLDGFGGHRDYPEEGSGELMRWYTVRWTVLRPVRLAVRGLAWLVSRVPGTTNGEVTEMGLTPCERCMGHAVVSGIMSGQAN